MEQRVLDQTLDQVQAYLEVGDLAGAIALIEALRPPDQADVFEELRIGEQEMLLPRLGGRRRRRAGQPLRCQNPGPDPRPDGH